MSLSIKTTGSETVSAAFTAGDKPGSQQLDRIAAHARAKGYAGGWAHGSKAARAMITAEGERIKAELNAQISDNRLRTESALAALGEAVEHLATDHAPALHDILDTLLEASLEFAEAILGHEVKAAQKPGREVLQRAMHAACDTQVVSVTMSPADADTLSVADVPENVTLKRDPSLAAGDAVVEHTLGRIELIIADAIDRARAELQS